MAETFRLAMIGSGSGTTAEYGIKALKNNAVTGEVYDVVPALVIATNQNAGIIEKAEQLHVPTTVVNPKDYATDEEFDDALLGTLYNAGIDGVSLNGCMVRIQPKTVAHFQPIQRRESGRRKRWMGNQHAGSLPETAELFGLQTHAATLLYHRMIGTEDPFTVMSFHQVESDEYDQGPLLAARRVPIRRLDGPKRLQDRGKKVEQQIFVRDILTGLANDHLPAVAPVNFSLDRGQQYVFSVARSYAQILFPLGE